MATSLSRFRVPYRYDTSRCVLSCHADFSCCFLVFRLCACGAALPSRGSATTSPYIRLREADGRRALSSEALQCGPGDTERFPGIGSRLTLPCAPHFAVPHALCRPCFRVTTSHPLRGQSWRGRGHAWHRARSIQAGACDRGGTRTILRDGRRRGDPLLLLLPRPAAPCERGAPQEAPRSGLWIEADPVVQRVPPDRLVL